MRARRASEIACKTQIFRFSECDREPFTREEAARTTKMYTLQPINVVPPCSPSKVMYQLPNILADVHDGSHTGADIDAKMPDNVITEQVIRLLQVSVSFPCAVPRCKQRYIVRSRAPVHAWSAENRAKSHARQPRPRLYIRTRHDDSSRKFPRTLIRDRSREQSGGATCRGSSLSPSSSLIDVFLPLPPQYCFFRMILSRRFGRASKIVIRWKKYVD